MSSALCLVCILFFSLTGITLNHASWFESAGDYQYQERPFPQSLHSLSAQSAAQRLDSINAWLQAEQHAIPEHISQSPQEIALDFPKPAGFDRITFDLIANTMIIEHQRNGLVAWLNDLHKGRHAGKIWAAVIDISAIVVLLFSLTGLILLYQHARRRWQTWPLLGLGLLLPVAIVIIFVP